MRLFIAIDFNELKEDLTNIQNNIDESLAKLKKTDTFHLTLKFLGKVSQDKAEQIKNKLKQIKFQKFRLTIDKIGVFPKEDYIRVIWMGVKPQEQVIELQKQIEDELKEFNFKKDVEFHPHITLVRVKSIDKREEFSNNLKNLKPREKTIEVTSFKLIESRLTRKGPVYEDFEVFPTT